MTAPRAGGSAGFETPLRISVCIRNHAGVLRTSHTDLQAMPGNIQNATPSGVMPYSLCVAFAESRECAQLQAQYHDGTTERSQLAQTSRKTFRLAQRSLAARAIALKAFWDGQQGGVVPFLFYNLAEGTYDATGNSTQGRYTVVFRGSWSQTTGLLRTDVPQIELAEVA